MNRKQAVRQAGRLVVGLMLFAWFSNITALFSKSINEVSSPRSQVQDPSGAGNSTISVHDIFWKDKARFNKRGDSLSPPRFLLGIMSHEMADRRNRESDRRQIIRNSYLSYYKDHGTSEELHRICGLHEIVNDQIPAADCQIAYTFVVGQSKAFPVDNRTELLNATKTSDMIRPHQTPDVISLDIMENGKYGKSPTWFLYASLLIHELDLPFNYVIKTDSDTLLIPARFLRWIDEQEKTVDYQRSQIYGGTPIDKAGCGWPIHDHCDNMTAPYFHGGGFYFASLDVSEYIVSDQCPRSTLFLPHEDITMGNYVHSMTAMTGKPIIGFKNPDGYHDTWRHPVKDPKRMKSLWKAYLNKKRKRIQATKEKLNTYE